jgi:hypothetical protein
MQRVESLPRNWTQADNGWQWTPPKEERQQAKAPMPTPVEVTSSPAEANARMLRTRPSLTHWREYWNDGGRLDLGGWSLRSVQGFREDES